MAKRRTPSREIRRRSAERLNRLTRAALRRNEIREAVERLQVAIRSAGGATVPLAVLREIATTYANSTWVLAQEAVEVAVAASRSNALMSWASTVGTPGARRYGLALARESVRVPPLSRQVWQRAYRQVVTELGSSLRTIARNSEGTWKQLVRLRETVGASPTGVRPTQAVARLMEAAKDQIRGGDPQAGARYQALRRRVEREIAKYQTSDYQGAAGQMLSAIDKAVTGYSTAAVDKAVEWQTYHKQTKVMQRAIETEQVKAWNTEEVRVSRNLPGVTGWEWETDSDPCPDCEALDGTFYPKDGDVQTPGLHPWCECRLVAAIDPDHIPTDEEFEEMIRTQE